MNTTNNNIERSYQLQRENFSGEDERTRRLRDTWFREDTIDYWRHHRMFIPLQPLLDYFPHARWLTVGDGRFGLDAIRLKKMQNGLDILPTDIAPELLRLAKEKKLISDYREENAESLSFADESFDFSFCKEAYHHFPRPYIALYEMLRVSKKGVVLVEPNEKKDHAIPERIVKTVKRSVKRLIRKPIPHPETWSFEVSGNFIYTVSKNEMEKIALGLQIPTVAFYYYNDYYEEGVELQEARAGNALFERVKRKIRQADRKCRMGLKTYSSIIAIIFKHSPDPELRKGLDQAGFKIVDLPENPFFKKRKEGS